MPDPPRRVTLFGLGGTISMTGSAARGVVPALSPDQLLASVPGLARAGVDVDVEDFRRVPGPAVGFADVYALARAIRDRLAEGIDGVVVTQGTDTIEESAYLLDLLHAGAAPVVMTGAMRNPTMAGADGPGNLLAAVQVAASREARGLGALVVFNDEIHAASRVRKTHATNAATFQSPDGGPLGQVVEGRAWFVNRPVRRTTVPVSLPPGREPRVGLVTVAFGDDGYLLDAIADRVDALVVAAFGAGHVPPAMVESLARAAERIPVVLASRTGAGPVLALTYGFAGSESDLLARGLISAGLLAPVKARVLLHTLISSGADREAVAETFAHAGGYA